MTAPSQAAPLLGAVLGDTYRILRLVATGGMGELYEATHLRLSGRYAIKVLLPQFAAYEEVLLRFQREAEITSRLRHPNIVSVLDFNTTPDGRAFLAMEFLEGRDLAEELAHAGPMSVPRAVDIVGQIASALSAAHAADVIHRDLKPHNLFLSRLPDGREMVKVLDFGISKVREARTKLTREHAIMGTPQYMAPEQALGNLRAIDHRTDQFSLAAIAYELLSGREAFRAETVHAILYQVVHELPAPLLPLRPDLPPAVEGVLFRALAKNPEARYDTIGAFGDALRTAALGDVPDHTPGATRRPTFIPGLGNAPTLRDSRRLERPDERHVTTFGASSAELSDEYLPRLRPPRPSWMVPALVLAGCAALGAAAWFGMQQEARRDPGPESGRRVADKPAERSPTPLPVPVAAPPAAAPESRPNRTAPAGDEPLAIAADPTPAEPPAVAAPPSVPTGTVIPADPTPSSPPTPPPPAPVVLANPPPRLRITVDGRPVTPPILLARRPGSYVLRFESPGRRPQTVTLDGLADRHEARLDMPRTAARGPAGLPGEPEDDVPELIPPQMPTEAAPRPRPSLIDDVETPAPTTPPPAEQPAEKPPLIDDI